MWVCTFDLPDLLKLWWAKPINLYGSKMFIFQKKIQRLKEKLKEWTKTCFKNIFDEKEHIEEKLSALGEVILNRGMSRVEIEKEKELIMEYNEILLRGECYWRSKSRDTWLEEGDLNTKYFHNSTKLK